MKVPIAINADERDTDKFTDDDRRLRLCVNVKRDNIERGKRHCDKEKRECRKILCKHHTDKRDGRGQKQHLRTHLSLLGKELHRKYRNKNDEKEEHYDGIRRNVCRIRLKRGKAECKRAHCEEYRDKHVSYAAYKI